jgi:hypothetical protein
MGAGQRHQFLDVVRAFLQQIPREPWRWVLEAVERGRHSGRCERVARHRSPLL